MPSSASRRTPASPATASRPTTTTCRRSRTSVFRTELSRSLGGRRARGALHFHHLPPADEPESNGMTALSLPRPHHIRPLALLVASVGIVLASQLGTLLQGPASAPAAPITVSGPVTPPGAPGAGPGSLAQIDHSIGIWTTNLAANDRDFLSAANLGALYEARARLSGDITDYARAEEAAGRSLAIEPRQLD